ncbi:photosynthetic complex assembly protein PuhC [Halorhodospira neutriphila]|nr:photosynthetic complex assembly protein PuhC [Halorhodospira neutriphila]
MSDLRAGPVSKVIMPVTALTIIALLTVYVLYTEWGMEDAEQGLNPPVAERALSFEDRDGEVVVRDARSGEVLEVLGTGEGAFIRSTVRQLAQQRTRTGDTQEVPFMLRGQADGRLLLADPVTGRRVDLSAFGKTNAAAFARFLEGQGSAKAQQQ